MAFSADSATEHDVNPRQKELHQRFRQAGHVVGKGGAIKGHDLRNIRHRINGQSRLAGGEQHISGSDRPLEVAGDRHADDRRDATAVERVPLYDNDRSTEAGF